MVLQLIFIGRVGKFSSNLPQIGFEFIFQPVFFHLPEDLDLHRIRLEIGPDIVMNGNYHLTIETLGHAQDIHRGHFVGHAARVLSIGAKGHIDLVIIAMLGIVIGVVRVTAVISIAARGFDQVVDCQQIHLLNRLAFQNNTRGGGNQFSAVKGIEGYDFRITDNNRISGPDGDTAFSRDPPAGPQLHTGLGTNEFDLRSTVLQDCCRHIFIDVIPMMVSGQDCINFFNRKRVEHAGYVTQVGLQFETPYHALMLVLFFHQLVLLSFLAVLGPVIDAEIGPALAFKPDAGTAKPPHGNGSFLNIFFLNLFVKPGPPFRKIFKNP